MSISDAPWSNAAVFNTEDPRSALTVVPEPKLEAEPVATDISALAPTVDRIEYLMGKRKEIDDQLEELKAVLQSQMDTAEVGLIDGHPRVRWTSHARTALDSTRLKRSLPDVWEQFSRTTTVRRFEVVS